MKVSAPAPEVEEVARLVRARLPDVASERRLPTWIFAFCLATGACGGGVDPPPADGGRHLPRVDRIASVNIILADLEGHTQLQVGATFSEWTLFADYVLPPDRTEGPCVISSLMGTIDPPNAPEPIERRFSAGVLTIAGPGDPLTLTPTAEGGYTDFFETPSRWLPGNRLDVTATGADLPAFAATVVVPSPPGVISPTVPDDTAHVAWTRGQPFVVRRRPGTTGTFFVNFNQDTVIERTPNSLSVGPPIIVSCSFPPETEVATVPAAALRDYLPSSTAANLNTSVSFYTTATAELPLGDRRVYVTTTYDQAPSLTLDVR